MRHYFYKRQRRWHEPKDDAMLMWRDACDDVERANARIEELHRRAMRGLIGVA